MWLSWVLVTTALGCSDDLTIPTDQSLCWDYADASRYLHLGGGVDTPGRATNVAIDDRSTG